MPETTTPRARGKTEVSYVVHPLSSGPGCWEARYAGDPDGIPGISAVSAEKAIADLHETETWLRTRDTRAAQNPEQKLMQAAADLTQVISRLGWQFRSQPAITPDGDVEITLCLGQEPPRLPPVTDALLELLKRP